MAHSTIPRLSGETFHNLFITLNKASKICNRYFISYVYIASSDAFENHIFFKISMTDANFMHLTGIKTKLDPHTFFDACYNEKLIENDLSNIQIGSYKYKQKLSVILKIDKLFTHPHLLVQENFHKNTISCSFAVSDGTFTLGFIVSNDSDVAVPMTLLKGDFLDHSKAKPFSCVIRKEKGEETKYDTIICGNLKALQPCYPLIKDEISVSLQKRIESSIDEEN